MTDHLKIATDALNTWYYSEIRSLVDAAIEACCGHLITLEIAVKRGDFSDVPRNMLASTKASYVEYRDRKTSDRSDGTDAREFMEEWVNQTTDGHQFCIYTHMAQLALATSSNSEAWEDLDRDNRPDDSNRACLAMRADVWEVLEARSEEWEVEDPEDDAEEGETHDHEICPCDACRVKRLTTPCKDPPLTPTELYANNRAKVGGLALIAIEIEPELESPKGLFSSGDDAEDAAMVAEIIERANSGDVWAWCLVEVRATCEGHVGSDVLGACSYKSERDFRSGAYYTDMVNQALSELARALTEAGVTL